MSLTWFACNRCGQILPVREGDGRPPADCSQCQAPLSPSREAPARVQWYYAQGRRKLGPVSWQQLSELANSGTLLHADMLLPAGTKKWLSAAEVDGLFAAEPAPTVAAEPVPLQQPAGGSTDASEPGMDEPATGFQAVVPTITAPGPEAAWPRVAGYEILSELGRGGMGVVYKARQVGLNRVVALKMILAGTHAAPQELARFRIEAESVARLQHPHIVQIYEIGEQDGLPFFSLEYVDGGSLDKKLAGTPLASRETALLVELLARAMHVAHECGIVHRDLKPANILLEMRNGEWGMGNKASAFPIPHSPFPIPKITDFGLAKQLDTEAGGTRTGAVLGTPSYMAPEQAMGKGNEIGPAADIYALGAICYELLTGRPPFKGVTAMDTLIQVMGDDPVAPSRLQLKVPRDLETICMKCLAKEPHRRYATAAALADDLQHFLRGEPIAARPASGWERGIKWVKRRPAVAGLIALVVFTAGLGFAGVSWKWREAVEQTRETKAALAQAETNLYFHRIALAQGEWQARHAGRAEELLDACPEPLRHWEWRYLKRLCHEEIHAWTGHEGQILQVTYSRDGRSLATAGEDRTVRIWDAARGAVRFTLRGHSKPVWSTAFSPNGKLLASASADRTVKLWNTATGAEILTFRGHRAPVRGVAFRPDGALIASAAGEVLLWDPATGKVEQTLRGTRPECHSISFSPDGLRLAAVSYNNPPEIWNLKTGTALSLPTAKQRAIYGVAFSPNNRHLATAGSDRTVRVWDLNLLRQIYVLQGCQDIVSGISFSPDGQRLAGASADQTVTVWELKPDARGLVLRGHRGPVYSVAFSPDGRRLASAGADRCLRLWDPAVDPEVTTWQEAKAQFLAFSPDGRTVVAAFPGKATIRNAATGQACFTLADKLLRVLHCAAYSRDGQLLAVGGSASSGGMVKVWNAATHQPVCSFTGHALTAATVAFSPDSRLVASGSELMETDQDGNRRQRPGELKVWDARTGQERFDLRGHTDGVATLAFSPDNRLLASAGHEPAIRIWDVHSGQEVRTLRLPKGKVEHLAFSPDGRCLVSAGHDETIQLWDPISGDELQTLRGHTKWVNKVAFSPDGKRLASASSDGTVKLWDPATGHEVLTLIRMMGSLGFVGVAYSEDGRRLAAATWNNAIRIWDAGP